MSDEKSRRDPNPRRTARLVTVLLILLGIVALLPGVCSIMFARLMGGAGALGLLTGLVGLAIIGVAVARIFSPPPNPAIPQKDERGCLGALLIVFGLVVIVGVLFVSLVARLLK
jgi:Na+/proline symporter